MTAPHTSLPERALAGLPPNFWLSGQQVSAAQRRGRYVPASIRHPGKMLPSLARAIIETYTKPGDWILDPLSGIGTTGVEAIHLGRHYVGIELEERWAQLQEQNLALARSQSAAGRSAVFAADARRLGEKLGAIADFSPAGAGEVGCIDAVITSPPYGNRLSSVRAPTSVLRHLIRQGRFRAHVIPSTYGQKQAQLGDLSEEDYFSQMRQVYAGCVEVLKPDGYLVVVIRPGRDRQRLRPLHHQTARLLTELGLVFLDEIAAIISSVRTPAGEPPQVGTRASFFKRLAIAHQRAAGWPISLDQIEYVLVFRKPGSPERPSARVFRMPSPNKSGRQAALAGRSG